MCMCMCGHWCMYIINQRDTNDSASNFWVSHLLRHGAGICTTANDVNSRPTSDSAWWRHRCCCYARDQSRTEEALFAYCQWHFLEYGSKNYGSFSGCISLYQKWVTFSRCRIWDPVDPGSGILDPARIRDPRPRILDPAWIQDPGSWPQVL